MGAVRLTASGVAHHDLIHECEMIPQRDVTSFLLSVDLRGGL
jgi:hypothetical protein